MIPPRFTTAYLRGHHTNYEFGYGLSNAARDLLERNRVARNRVVLSDILISDTYPHTSARWCTRKEDDNGCANRDGYNRR
jgi:hypothetical protein